MIPCEEVLECLSLPVAGFRHIFFFSFYSDSGYFPGPLNNLIKMVSFADLVSLPKGASKAKWRTLLYIS